MRRKEMYRETKSCENGKEKCMGRRGRRDREVKVKKRVWRWKITVEEGNYKRERSVQREMNGCRKKRKERKRGKKWEERQWDGK